MPAGQRMRPAKECDRLKAGGMLQRITKLLTEYNLRMKSPTLIFAVATVYLLLTGTHAIMGQVPASSKPNFIILLTDDQGYQDLGCYGSPNIKTPRIDAMASQGIRFTNFYAQPVCGPSRKSILTGCYPLRTATSSLKERKTPHPCLLYTSPSPRDRQKSRMPSSA